MKLSAVHHDSRVCGQFDQFSIYVIGHGTLQDFDEFQILMSMADGRIVGISGQEPVFCISRKEGVVICDSFRGIKIESRAVFRNRVHGKILHRRL